MGFGDVVPPVTVSLVQRTATPVLCPEISTWEAVLASDGMRECAVSIAMERRRRRVNWFRHGVHALSCVLSPEPPEAYLCPLCLNLFTREQLDAGVLTDEHVPPEATGGEPLVLTCLSCNNAGSALDEAMANAEKRRTFGKPHTLGPLPGSVSIKGIRNNGSIRFDGETFVMLGDPGQNNPATLADHTAALDQFTGGSTMELRLPVKANPRRVAMGWMRSAYLTAFAVYGYSYVLQPAFSPLRGAIADYDDTSFDVVLIDASDDGALNPLVAEVTGPAPLEGCRAVVFGPRLILLPPWEAPENWFATLRERLINEAPQLLTLVSVIGRRFPEHPMHLTDG